MRADVIDQRLLLLGAVLAIIVVLSIIMLAPPPLCNLPNIPVGCTWVSTANATAQCAGHVYCPSNPTANHTYATCKAVVGAPPFVSVCTVYVGQRISNFELLMVNAANHTIYGYEWYEYPAARLEPVNATLMVGSTVGYSCDGSLATLTAINQSYATFMLNATKSRYGCPI